MATNEPNLGQKLNKYFTKLGSTAHQKYGKAISELPAKAYSLTKNVDDTIKDLPKIAIEQAYTAGPITLDALNDYVYKPVKRNIQGLVTGNAPSGDNYLDKVADQARAQKENFYKTETFNQGMNKKYGAVLGDVLEMSAPIPAGKSKIVKNSISFIEKYSPRIANYVRGLIKKGDTVGEVINKVPTEVKGIIEDSTSLVKVESKVGPASIVDKAKQTFANVVSKDRKIKKAKDELTTLEKQYSKEKKNLTPEQQKLAEDYIEKQKATIESMTNNTWEKHLEKTKKQNKVSKDLDSIVNPKDKMSKTKKGLIITGGLGVGGAVYEALTGGEDKLPEDLTPIETTVPNTLTNDSNIDTAQETKKSGPEKAPGGKSPSSAQGSVISTESVVAGTVYAQDGSAVPLYLIGGSYKVKKPDGSYHTLTSGVTNENKRHKYTMIANTPLPF